MKFEALLDTPAILANQAAPVHLMLRFTAGTAPGGRERPIAFAAVLDRSGSMSGPPLAAAREAAKLAVRNLRPDDHFALVVFDDQAQTIVPLQTLPKKQATAARIEAITSGSSTNLTAGWMLARDELLKAPAGMPRRILLLTDGLLNVGITEPAMVRKIVASGLEEGGIRTSCLGLGPEYDEKLLVELSGATAGAFHDANSAEKLPAIFAAELEGLQATAVQNLRVRVRRLDFCESLALLADYPAVELPDGRIEIAVGDLVSEEERTLVAELQVLPIPLLGDGRPAASLEGELLLELEVVYDEIVTEGIQSCAWKQALRVLPVQDPASVVVNGDVIPWVAQQRAGRIAEEALHTAEGGDLPAAIARLRQELQALERLGPSEAAREARRFVQDFLDRLVAEGAPSAQFSKTVLYSSSSRRRMSSAQHWLGEDDAPSFIKPRPQGKKPAPPDSTPQAGGGSDTRSPDEQSPEGDSPEQSQSG